MRRFELVHALIIVLAAACGGPSATDDAGTRDAGDRVDAPPVVQCEREDDCLDSLYCTVHRCMPGAPGADARGCVLEGDPCGDGERCVESESTCVTEACTGVPDADIDGEPSFACGGMDCDDDDGNRYPGNPGEVCDAEGHDEDCLDGTVASATDGDVDGDGFTSALCCNGATCGDDCDDEDRATNPDAREVCNGRDDDCDGSTDEAGATPLCPGGTCTAGRCDLAEWSRTFGGADEDRVNSVAMDDLGNVYITGTFSGSAYFGSATGPEVSVPGPGGAPSSDWFIASFTADGRYRWVRTVGTSEPELGYDVAFDRVSGQVFATGVTVGSVDLGSGPVSGHLLVALDVDGTVNWVVGYDLGAISVLLVDADDGPVVTGQFRGTRSLGGAPRTAASVQALFVTRLDSAGTYLWDYVSRGSSEARFYAARIALAETGRVTVAGWYSSGAADLGLGLDPNRGGDDALAFALDSDGTPLWRYVAGGVGDDRAFSMRATATGEVFLVGSFEGSVDFGAGPVAAPASESAFLLALGSTGSLVRVGAWGGGTRNEAIAVDFNAAGDLLIAGTYSGTVNFGGGPSSAPPGGAAYLVTFDAALNHVRDRTVAYPGFPGSPCPSPTGCSSAAMDIVVGPADSTAMAGLFSGSVQLGSTARTGEGGLDGFVFRLGN